MHFYALRVFRQLNCFQQVQVEDRCARAHGKNPFSKAKHRYRLAGEQALNRFLSMFNDPILLGARLELYGLPKTPPLCA
jgi:hypothetical protein